MDEATAAWTLMERLEEVPRHTWVAHVRYKTRGAKMAKRCDLLKLA